MLNDVCSVKVILSLIRNYFYVILCKSKKYFGYIMFMLSKYYAKIF